MRSAEAYCIDHLVGSISPGRIADIPFVEDLRKFNIDNVIAKGKLTVENSKMVWDLKPPKRSATVLQSMKLKPVTVEDMTVHTDIKADKVKVLSMEIDFDVPFVRTRRDVVLPVKDGKVLPDVANDVLYATIVERFGKSNNKFVAFVSGWKLKAGAMASSSAPDDNNVVCIGTNPEDMAMSVNYLAENGGGQVIVRDGKVLGFLSLPICGIVANMKPKDMAAEEEKLKAIVRGQGCDLPVPVFYMCCLQITSIPDYAMTDLGPVDYHTQKPFDPILGAA